MYRRLTVANVTDSIIDAGYGILPVHGNENHHWYAVLSTRWGHVLMEARRWNSTGSTWLTFIWQGCEYQRHLDRFYSPRYTMRLGWDFARAVVEGEVQP